LTHEHKIWQENIRKKQLKDLEEADRKKQEMLREHKKKYLEESVRMELA